MDIVDLVTNAGMSILLEEVNNNIILWKNVQFK